MHQSQEKAAIQCGQKWNNRESEREIEKETFHCYKYC